MMPSSPSAPIATNQNVMIGPNRRPMRAVPWGCRQNNAINTKTDSGNTYGANSGTGVLIPSSALSTDIAGVMAPSP